MAATVFISYSSSDAPLASSIYAYLNDHGIQALKAPEDIRPGEDWAGSITGMIESSTHMVLIWTSFSMASKEVAKELTLAMQSNTIIIPFQVHELAPEGAWRYHLANLHWLQAYNTDHESACRDLLHQIQGLAPAINRPSVLGSTRNRSNSRLISLLPLIAFLASVSALLINFIALTIGILFGFTQPQLQQSIVLVVGGIYRTIPPLSMGLYLTSLAAAIWGLCSRSGKRKVALSAIVLTFVQLMAYAIGAFLGIMPR